MGMKNSESSNKKKKESELSKIKQETFIEKGNSYQAGGDINVYTPESSNSSNAKPKPNLLGTWQSRLGIIVALIGIITFFLFTIPKEMGWKTNEKAIIQQDSIFVSGIIRTKGTNKGIPNAWITTDLSKSDTLITTSDGTFEFYVKGKSGESIRIYVGAKGYESRNEYHILPKSIAIYLDKK
jgi:ribosomal protein L27